MINFNVVEFIHPDKLRLKILRLFLVPVNEVFFFFLLILEVSLFQLIS